MFDMPAAAVNMIGSDHVFFAASIGIDEVDMRRDVSFCAHAITQGEVMVVPDATVDERFHDNPLVTGSAGLRFYAGVPLFSPGGHPLGALCVIDSKPHPDFSRTDRDRLRELAQMASDRLELRRVEVAARLARQIGADDLVARIGGDEFAILMPDVTDFLEATEVALAANAAIAQPIVVDGQEIRVAASCGVALAPSQAQDPMELVSDAGAAIRRVFLRRSVTPRQ